MKFKLYVLSKKLSNCEYFALSTANILVLCCFIALNHSAGWLSLENDDAPGNLGLHDQYLALLWVQRNIKMFGGDPDNVTLLGVSAGAMTIMCHLISPFSGAGLFHRIIALSGKYLF